METILEALRRNGIEAEQRDNMTWIGTTPNGNHFYIEKACGTFNQYTLSISKEDTSIYYCAHCLFRTALQKIKAN